MGTAFKNKQIPSTRPIVGFLIVSDLVHARTQQRGTTEKSTRLITLTLGGNML